MPFRRLLAKLLVWYSRRMRRSADVALDISTSLHVCDKAAALVYCTDANCRHCSVCGRVVL